jgi:hypothetical protein
MSTPQDPSGTSIKGSLVAAILGGMLAVGLVAALAIWLMPKIMPRMMASGDCSERMRECMEKCGCGPSKDDPED